VNTPERLELTCSRAWPPLVEEPLGEWSLRWADGFTGRANSALAVGDARRPVGDALRAVCDFAHDRGITPMVQVVRDSPNERAIAAAGWVPATGHGAGHEVVVLTAPLTRHFPYESDASSPPWDYSGLRGVVSWGGPRRRRHPRRRTHRPRSTTAAGSAS
jgi:hypothetical protein